MFLISACLIGENVKYDGHNNYHQVARELYEKGLAIPVCPEVFGGMSIPRIPSEIKDGKVVSKIGEDVTELFHIGAEKTLRIAQQNNISIAILQSRSPSCGSKQIYDGTFSNTLIDGQGITTKLLEQNGIQVITIEDFVKDYYENIR